HPAARVLLQQRVENRVADLVGDLVRVALGHGLRGEQATGHADSPTIDYESAQFTDEACPGRPPRPKSPTPTPCVRKSVSGGPPFVGRNGVQGAGEGCGPRTRRPGSAPVGSESAY